MNIEKTFEDKIGKNILLFFKKKILIIKISSNHFGALGLGFLILVSTLWRSLSFCFPRYLAETSMAYCIFRSWSESESSPSCPFSTSKPSSCYLFFMELSTFSIIWQTSLSSDSIFICILIGSSLSSRSSSTSLSCYSPSCLRKVNGFWPEVFLGLIEINYRR